MENVTLQQIETFGAGLVALLLVFSIVILMIKEVIPALKEVGKTLATSIAALGTSIALLDKTMLEMQRASAESIHSLENRVLVLESKLDTHTLVGTEIKQILIGNTTALTEVKERTRNCARTPDTRSRKEDK
jgi:hypothetical protein